MSNASALARKLRALLLIYWQETLAYPAAAFIWVLADTQMALVMPAVWLSAFSADQAIFGMAPGTLVTYYLATLLLSQFVICHLMWDIGFEIREGVFSTQLLRPVSVFWMNAARNVAWRSMKLFLFVPLLVIFVLVYGKYLGATPLYLGWPLIVCILLAHVLSFMMGYALAMVSLWTTEYVSVFQVYYFPEIILSGRLVPVDALPSWAVSIADVLPFKYTIYLPINALLGRVESSQLLVGMGIQAAWIAVFAVLGRVLLRRGLKQYTGFGH